MTRRSLGELAALRALVMTATVVALIGSAAEPSLAAERRTRMATRTYMAAGARAVPLVFRVDPGLCAASASVGCVRFRTQSQDSHVRVLVRDGSGTGPVLASLAQDLDGDGLYEANAQEHFTMFCGKSPSVRIRRPGTDVAVFLYEARAGAFLTYGLIPIAPYLHSCDRAVATTGMVKAVFSRPAGR